MMTERSPFGGDDEVDDGPHPVAHLRVGWRGARHGEVDGEAGVRDVQARYGLA